MKTLSCSGNESVSWRKGTWRITVKDDKHYNSHGTLKSGINIQTLLDCYVFTFLPRLIGILTFEIW